MPSFSYKDISTILNQAEKGHTFPVYLMIGDSFLINEVHQKLIPLLIPPEHQAFNLEIIDGEKEDLGSILDRLQTFPFFPGRKVVSVRNPVHIFSAGNEERLLKKTEEAWQKGQAERSARLLRTLLQNIGVPFPPEEGTYIFPEKAIKETVFPGNGGVPDWFKEVYSQVRSSSAEDSGSLTPDQSLISALQKGFPEGHILILLLEEPSPSKKILTAISEYGAVINLAIKQGKKGEQTAALKGFLKTRLRQEGKTILPQAEALLLERVGPETFLLEMEVQKLVAYCGSRKQIHPQDVIEISGALREEPLYELATVLGEGHLEESLRKLNQLWQQGYNPLQILAAITNSIRRLLTAGDLFKTLPETPPRVWQDFGSFSTRILPQLKQSPLPAILAKVHPFVLFTILKTARNFSQPFLLQALENLHQADRMFKTSGATPAFLLEDFIISFCNRKSKVNKRF